MNSKKKIWVIQTGEPLSIDGGHPRPMRAMNLTRLLLKKGYEVTLVSSDFYHQNKTHRFKKYTDIIQKEGNRLVLIPSPGYIKHIGLMRIIDHMILGFRFYLWLKKQIDKPDCIFIGYPPIELSFFLANWAKKNNLPYIIDVKDLWPDLFLEIFPKKFNFIFTFFISPYFFMKNKALKNARAFCTISENYLKWMLKASGRKINEFDTISNLSAPDPNKLCEDELYNANNWWLEEHKLDLTHRKRFIFIGSFMSVYNFHPIRDIFKKLRTFINDFEIIICGRGPYKSEIEDIFKNEKNFKLIDWIDYPKIVALSKASSGAIIPYKNIDNFINNIPNKVIDSLSFGLPLISVVNGEIFNLINKYDIGIHIDEERNEKSIQYLCNILNNEEFFQQKSKNCKKLFYDKYSLDNVYSKIIQNIEKILS